MTEAVSWGNRCGDKDQPGVYADLRKFVKFIEDARHGRIAETYDNCGIEYEECGMRTISHDSSQPNMVQSPWQVQILHLGTFYSGGVIIDRTTIITAGS